MPPMNKIPDGRRVGNDSDWQHAIVSWKTEFNSALLQHEQETTNATLSDGFYVTGKRSEIIIKYLHEFFNTIIADIKPTEGFLISLTGSGGRRQISFNSDVDIALIFENLHANDLFNENLKVRIAALDFIPGLSLYHRKICMLSDIEQPAIYSVEQFNALKDRYTLYQTQDFADRVVQLCKDVSDRYHLECTFEGISYLRKYAVSPDDFTQVDIKEELRRAQIPMWIYGNAEFLHSHEVYERAHLNKNGTIDGLPNQSVIEALGVLLMWRNWFEQHAHKTNDRSVSFRNIHIPAFIENFGETGLGKLIWARRTIAHYKNDALDQLSERGIIVPDTNKKVIWGNSGASAQFAKEPSEFSTQFFSFYKAVQRWNLPVANQTERELRWQAQEKLNLTSGFISILESKAPLAKIVNQWRDFGILPKLIDKFEILETQLYRTNHRSDGFTKAARAVDRIKNLDKLENATFTEDENQNFFLTLYRDLQAPTLAALRLALLVEEIPEDQQDGITQPEQNLHDYVTDQLARKIPSLSSDSARVIEFLIKNKREILTAAEQCAEQNNIETWLSKVAKLKIVDPAEAVRALTLFAYAAFDYKLGEHVSRARLTPWQWKNLITLSENLLLKISGIDATRSEAHMYSPDDLKICNNIPERLKNSPLIRKFSLGAYGAQLDPYRLNPVINSIKTLLKNDQPVIKIMPSADDDLAQAHIYAWDKPGIFWQIAQAFYEAGASIAFTHLYSIPNPESECFSLSHVGGNVIYDLIRFKPKTLLSEKHALELKTTIEEKLATQLDHSNDTHFPILQKISSKMNAKLTSLGANKYQLHYHHDDSPGILYAICRYLSEVVEADIFDILPASDKGYIPPVPTNVYFSSNLNSSEITERLDVFLAKA